MNSAVLLLGFNRPDSTARVFDAIRAARPPRLYVSVDGPRPGRPGEAELCARVSAIASDIDWPCVLHTRFLGANEGCREAVGGALDWFFANEPEGIVLEDDVLPVPSFFEYCDELLARYRDDPSIAAIGGSNFIASSYRPADSYFFSRYTHVWGWATWRRAWALHDRSMAGWPNWRDRGGLDDALDTGWARRYWRERFDSVYTGRLSSWAFPWLFSCWTRGALAVIPAENLTTNLGFGPASTHTRGVPSFVRRSPARELATPLRHPLSVERNAEADHRIESEVFDIGAMGAARHALRRLLRRIRRRA